MWHTTASFNTRSLSHTIALSVSRTVYVVCPCLTVLYFFLRTNHVVLFIHICSKSPSLPPSIDVSTWFIHGTKNTLVVLICYKAEIYTCIRQKEQCCATRTDICLLSTRNESGKRRELTKGDNTFEFAFVAIYWLNLKNYTLIFINKVETVGTSLSEIIWTYIF